MKRKAPKLLRLFMVMALIVGVIGAVVPAGKVGAAGDSQVTVSTLNAGKNAIYTITTASMTSTPIGGTITIGFPAGTTVPAVINNTSVSIAGVAPTADPIVNSRAVTITNNSAAACTACTIQFAASAGIKNPGTVGAKTLTVKSSVDATGNTSTSYTIVRYVSPSSTSKAQGAAITLTGAGFSAGTTIKASGTVSGSSTVAADGSFSIAGTRTGTATGTSTVTDGTGNTATSASITLKPDISIAGGSGAYVNGTISISGRNFGTAANIADATAIVFAGTTMALQTGNVVSTLGTAFTDRDLDGVADDFLLKIRVPSGTNTGTWTVKVTDNGAATASTTVATTGRTLTLSPSSGRTGTITVTGTGFPASQAAGASNVINLAQAGVNGDLAAPLISTDTAGGFETTFTMPANLTDGSTTAIVAGAVTVKATVLAPGSTSGDGAANSKTATYTYGSTSRTVTISPTSGPRGTVITVNGSGFNKSATIAVSAMTVGGAAMNTVAGSTTADGKLTASTQTVPSSVAYGASSVKVTDSGVGTARSGTATFTAVQPTIAISPASGPVGTTTTVTGAGWLPNGLVTISRAGTSALTTTADALGAITAQLPIPSASFSSGGTVRLAVTATDGSSNSAAGGNFTISAASISMSPATGAVADTITVTGVNYLPTTGLTAFTVGGVSVLPTTPVISNATGEWTATFAVPGLSGVQTVSTTHSSVTKTATLTITAAAGGAGQALAVGTAVSVLETAGSLELITAYNYTTNAYEAYVPGLAGNALENVQPNSVIFLTLTADTTVVVSGNTFTVKAATPTPIPVGNTVSITLG